MLFPPGEELGGEKPGQQVQGDAPVNHGEELMVQEYQLLDGVLLRREGGAQRLILLVEDVGEGAEQSVLAVEVMVKGALGGLGLKDDVLDGGVLIALLVKELPGGGDDAALGVPGVLTGHGGASFPGFMVDSPGRGWYNQGKRGNLSTQVRLFLTRFKICRNAGFLCGGPVISFSLR